MRSNINVPPIIWWNQSLCIERETLYIWFKQDAGYLLLHGHPGHIVDQLLLDSIVGLQAGIWILHDISLLHLRLQRLLRRGIRTMVLTKAHAVLGCTFIELQRCPVLWIRVVSDP